jgi:hypothetical protein
MSNQPPVPSITRFNKSGGSNSPPGYYLHSGIYEEIGLRGQRREISDGSRESSSPTRTLSLWGLQCANMRVRQRGETLNDVSRHRSISARRPLGPGRRLSLRGYSPLGRVGTAQSAPGRVATAQSAPERGANLHPGGSSPLNLHPGGSLRGQSPPGRFAIAQSPHIDIMVRGGECRY